jgi:hypothetical protein
VQPDGGGSAGGGALCGTSNCASARRIAVNGAVIWSLMAGFARRVCQEAKELAAGRVERPLFGFRLAMGERRPAIVANEVEYDVLDRLLAEAAVALQSANDLAAKDPDFATMLTQGVAR